MTATNEATPPMAADDTTRKERFREVYLALYDDLWRYCLRRTSTAAEAEDVLGDAFAVAWHRIDDMPPDPGARPWLFAIARNHIRNRWRQSDRNEAVRLRLVTETVTADIPSIGDSLESDDDSAQVHRALARLDESDAEILRLACWEELPHSEIADVMECSENAVAIRLHRARKRLAATLSDRSSTPTTHRTNSTDTRSQGELQ